MATTYKEGRVIEQDGVVRPEPAPVTVEDATGTSEPESVVVPDVSVQIMYGEVSDPRTKLVKAKVKAPPKVKALGKHKR